jgi:uncharacterized protein YbcC (UPF0753/DUF2309 family)
MSDPALLLQDDALAGTTAETLEPENAAAVARPVAASPTLAARVARACGRVAPLWPLEHFVAVNPFLGLADQTFTTAATTVRRIAGARMTLPRRWYREQLDAGRITDADLEAALEAHRRERPDSPLAPLDAAALRAACESGEDLAPEPLPTVAEAIDRARGTRWATLAIDEISKWCAAYYDQGQSAWRMPWRGERAYPAWRAAAALDRTPEAMGARGFRSVVGSLPQDPLAAIAVALERLGPPSSATDDYLHRALATVGGWSAHARYRAWGHELRGQSDDSVAHLLAIRLAWDLALAESVATADELHGWRERIAQPVGADEAREISLGCVLQDAFERSWQRTFMAQLTASAPAVAATARPEAQAVFCIDVRSEVYRRALESVTTRVTTHGFAGFFGFAIEYVPLGQQAGGAQCPVLLTPAHRVRETVRGAEGPAESRILELRRLRRRAIRAWKSFKTSAVSCFSYVETAGLLFAPKLIGDAFALTRTVEHPSVEGVDEAVRHRLAPEIDRRGEGAQATGFALDTRIASAAGALRAMGLTRDFGRLVLLCGHGSTTVNNPYASGLDCGACGGHTGEANARVAVAILNEPAVRAGLHAQGLTVPDDTVFVAGLHDTTTDEIRLYDTESIPPTHGADLARLRADLQRASALARAERTGLLGVDGTAGEAAVARAIDERSRDWAQVRPEWGLAGNAAFVAAPRDRTRGLDLGGRVFLHDYDAAKDPSYGILELIMTAPMVVANWINLQYYGSTVDNAAFGSGNKALHNVVGTLGVLEGNAGDLRTGLPWQSVHDGTRFVHEPLRLNVCIQAPIEQMNRILEKHANVRQLLDHGWLHLYAIEDDGRRLSKYARDLAWEPVAA